MTRRIQLRHLLLLVALIAVFAGRLGASSIEEGQPHPEDIRLVVVIAVDQLRGDYLDRFAEIMPKGFQTLRKNGIVFSDAHHEHAITATAPGHATLSTGSYPSHSGIVGNEWYEDDGQRKVYCVEDPSALIVGNSGPKASSAGRSPANLLVSGLPDWIKSADGQSRVFTASRKDRAAVLLGGKGADAAFWYDTANGQFVSSTHYMKSLPAWAKAFNEKDLPAAYFGDLWKPLSTEGVDLNPMDVSATDAGWFRRAFPHALGGDSTAPDSEFYTAFGGTPFMDQFLADFTAELVRAEKLGQGTSIDYLGVSFSALDSVGHEYGPNSLESLDQMRRLDAILGEFLTLLDELVGLNRVAVVLSADHGVMDLPEYRTSRQRTAHRMDDTDIACLQTQAKEFLIRYGAEEDWFVNGYYLDYAALGRHNLKRQDVERSAADLLEGCEIIQKVWTKTELEVPSQDHFHTLFRNSFYPSRSPDLYIQPKEQALTSQGLGSSHGTPYEYDTHVPLIFMLPGKAAKVISNRVRTVDLAPTIASFIGVPVPANLDGKDLAVHFK